MAINYVTRSMEAEALRAASRLAAVPRRSRPTLLIRPPLGQCSPRWRRSGTGFDPGE